MEVWTRREKEEEEERRLCSQVSFLKGGVKGMFSLRILERLLAKFPKLIDEVDLIAGTSTGGLIALMLANGYSPTQGFMCFFFFQNLW